MSSASTPEEIALFAVLYPKSIPDLLPVIKTTQPFIRNSKVSSCSSFSYFEPSKRKGARNPYLKKSPNVVAGIEIYGEKAALSRQLEHPLYQKFRDSLEKISEKQDELITLYPSKQGGFASRGGESSSATGDKDVLVVFAKMTVKEGKRDDAVAVFAPFADWVRDNEPDTLTYTFMTRKKAPDEIFVFERYRNAAAFAKHAKSKEASQMAKSIGAFLKGMELSEWTEINDISFVGKELEPKEAISTSKL